jgi:hypothetical protein
MFRNASLFVFLLLLFHCSQIDPATDKAQILVESALQNTDISLDWLEGEWRDSSSFGGRAIFVENWKESSDNSLVGSKFQIVNGEPSSSTGLSLLQTDGKYYYSYTEAGEQTTFVQDSVSEGFLRFVNTTDKFPTNLSYLYQEEVLTISFSGLANGVFRSAAFRAKKEKK